jgi:hypothetical protein
MTAIPFLDALYAPKTKPRPNPFLAEDKGPVLQYLPYLNTVLVVVLGLLGVVRGEEIWWGFGWIPGAIWAVVLIAKLVMGSVDPEAELGDLRYEFKGA